MSDRNLRLQVVLGAVDKLTRPLKKAQGGSKQLATALKTTQEHLKKLNQQSANISGFRQLRTQLAGAKNDLTLAQQKVTALSSAFSASTSPTQKQVKALASAKRQASQLKDAYQRLQESVQRQRRELNSAGIDTKKLSAAQRRLKTDTQATTRTLAQQHAQLKALGERQAKINSVRNRYHKSTQRRAMIAGVGYTSLATGRTLFNGLKNTLKVGYDFDGMMSKTQAVTRIQDKNSPDMMALRHQARTLPLQSKFTDLEVAEGQYFLGRTGYSAKQIRGAMPGMLSLAAAGDIDLGTTADIASNIQTAMGIPAEKMGHVADVLTALFTRNNVDIPMLGESLKYSAGVGREYGQSLETISAATAMLGSAGIQGSQAGTTMRSILSRIGTSKAVAELGVNTKDSAGNMRDMVDILKDINKKTASMGNIERGQIFKNIAGQYAVTGFGVLMHAAGDGSLEKMRGKPGEYDGEAARVSKTMLDNMAGDMTMLHAALENISVELFEKNNRWLRKLTTSISGVLHGVAEFLKAHPALSKALVVIGTVVAGATVFFGGLMFAVVGLLAPLTLLKFQLMMLGIKGSSALGLLGKSVTFLGSVLMTLGRLMWANPILAIIGIIAVGALYIWQNWSSLAPKIQALWEAISTTVSRSWQEIKQLFTRLWSEIISEVKALPETFQALGGALIDNLLAGINEKWEALKSKLASLSDYLPDWLTGKNTSAIISAPGTPPAASRAFAGMYDTGGRIGCGQFGIAGENGPEIVNDPANITSRRKTAALASVVAGFMGVTLPQADAQAIPLITATPNSASTVTRTPSQPSVITHRYDINVPITIYAQPGQSASDIASEVARQLEARERKAQAKARSNFSDQGGLDL